MELLDQAADRQALAITLFTEQSMGQNVEYAGLQEIVAEKLLRSNGHAS